MKITIFIIRVILSIATLIALIVCLWFIWTFEANPRQQDAQFPEIIHNFTFPPTNSVRST